MALSPQALIKGLVSRVLPAPNTDGFNTDVALRLDRYGGAYTQPLVRREHALADEGTYFIANNAQTGVAVTQGTAFAATSPVLTIYNGLAAGGASIYLAYVALVAAVAETCASAGVSINIAFSLDTGNRYTSGGTVLGAAVNPNMGLATTSTGVIIAAGAITATAASGSVRNVVGIRTIRPAVSGTVLNVIGDMHLLTFGAVEGATGSITIANANVMPQAMPPIVIGPNQTGLLYIWFNATTPANGTFAPEVGFWLR